MGLLYLIALLVSLGCMLLIDRRFRLFFWHDAFAATIVTVTGTLFFLLWDIAGIASGIFLRGDSGFASGIVLAPQLPLEEPVFLIFLVVCTMIVYTGAVRLIRARRSGRPTPGPRERTR